MRILVVGAGFAGAVYGRCLAENGHKVTVIDRRDHIGGNAYDYVDQAGVRVHKYGPHLFHTNNKPVVEWLERFGTFAPYEHSVTVRHGGKFLPLPISRATFETYYERTFASDAELSAFLQTVVTACPDPRNAADYLNSAIGRDLTDLIFRPYTRKMWGHDLEDMDPQVVRRISIQLGYEHKYFPHDRYQMLPTSGYEKIFGNIFDHDNVELRLSTRFDPAMRNDYAHTFSSAAIDEHYDYCFEDLPYRSIRFHHSTSGAATSGSAAPTPVVNYSDEGPYTRETHWDMLPNHRVHDTGFSTKTVEEPCDYRSNQLERYYPIRDALGRNQARYAKYKELARGEHDLDFIGRCGTYQYLDMHQVINQALQGVQSWLRRQN